MISTYQKSKVVSLFIFFHWMGKHGLCSGYVMARKTKFQDLTHPFKNDFTRTWPINKPFKFTIGTRGLTTLGDVENVYLENNEFFMPEHAGTHMDAPAHFTKGGNRVDKIPFSDLIGPGVKLDISQKARNNLDTTLTVQDLKDWERKNGKIPRHAVVLLYTGQSKFYDDENKFFGREEGYSYPDTEHIHFPGFSAEAAEWLVNERDIVGVGTDCASFDAAISNTFPAHQILLGAGKWGLENVANLDQLPDSGYTVFNMVFKLHDGSGAPTRLYASFDTPLSSRSSLCLPQTLSVLSMAIAAKLTWFLTN